ncbi:hypothetical protein TorRG33x02_259610 [Trema orientale]|uniref:Uncharacterized protein n=1 Tax=Trema orientale TaxID=63057 RepID=A0A2P5D7X4_TREOI|nr:hypothetical protein TorRG33x02_259610 [Trema orientale]
MLTMLCSLHQIIGLITISTIVTMLVLGLITSQPLQKILDRVDGCSQLFQRLLLLKLLGL